MSKITAIINQKGGTGKTTTAVLGCNVDSKSNIQTLMALVNVMSRELVLKSVLENKEKDYDYILIDCSPSLGMLTINALASCNSVIVPVTSEYLSAKGRGLLVNNINRIRKRINSQIEIAVKTGEAILNKKSILEYAPDNKVAKAYVEFSKEWSSW